MLLPVHVRKGDLDVRLFSVLSTVGVAIDVTLQELRIETFFPADERSAEAWGRLASPDRARARTSTPSTPG